MPDRHTRRRVLAGAGTVTLGSLLSACGGNGDQARTGDGVRTTVPRAGRPDGGAGLFADASACTLTAEQTAGPYYVETDAIRSDIRDGRRGSPLRVVLRVRDAACRPAPDAVVDIWHCDAGGVYSGVGAGAREQRFLRGTQVTDRDGLVEFQTIFPGSYPGRTVHVHAMVHLDARAVLTTQLYFDDALTDRLHAREPYTDAPARDQRNAADPLFEPSLVLRTARDGDGHVGVISFDIARP